MKDQCYELQMIAYKIITKGRCLDGQLQIAFIIDKLPPSFFFQLCFTTKQKNFLIESLIIRL